VKPGNAGGGKAATPARDPDRASTVRRDGESVLTRLDRITERARKHPDEVFNNLYHLLDVELLWHAFRKLKRDKAPGVDGVTVDDYEVDLMANLRHLVARLKRRTYRPLPSLRREIPKSPGKTRPLGIASLEDKIVQRALVMILERIYEEDFEDCSYGFRPGRSCHDALKALSRVIGTRKVNWVLDADIRGYFDHVDHAWLLRMLQHRVNDPQIVWLIRRFLKAGVLVEGKRLDTDAGVPQGACLSPLLANIYLHYVLDLWFQRVVAPRLRGEAYLLRYADDFICCFQNEQDAKRFREVLERRLGRFALAISPEKTKLIRFGRYARRDAAQHGEGKPKVFDFLGFTHYCGTSRKGRFKLKWRTSKKRYREKLMAIKEWLRANRTLPLAELWATLNRKLQGHYQYYGVSDNWPWLERFRRQVLWLAYRWLNRRSARRSFTVPGFYEYVDRFGLATPRRLINLNSAFV
jgi:group II intron reverse transcriptase/maturase